MKTYTDQLGNKITLNKKPERIVSLVPSQTELLYDLGLKENIVGITKFCIHPEELFQNTERIGGTKNLNFEKIAALKPDLIIGNKEENERSQIEELQKQYPVWMSDVNSLDDALLMIHDLGKITETNNTAEDLIININSKFSNLKREVKEKYPEALTCIYLIWKDPLMAVGKNTFIQEMLSICGLKVLPKISSSRYPELTKGQLKQLQPQLLLLSSEPYPFKKIDLIDFESILPNTLVKLVDGEMFSWYGSRLLKSADYFTEILPEIHAFATS